MFATLSSFLPSALQNSPNPSNGIHKDVPTATANVGEQPSRVASIDEVGVKKKERRTNNESFIVVRPPPAKSNHPLNLQVQLVPPQSRDRDRSMDTSTSSQEHDGATLSRTSSNRSDVSMYSAAYSSVTSFSSVTSTSTTSSRRMIIPLYNLQAHNVMTNVIVDAGTDAKVAKFQKRGLEVLGLAVLEPVEVFGSHMPSASLPSPSSNRPSIDEHHDIILHPAPPPGGPDGVHTPASSAISLSSGGVDPTSPPARPDNNLTPSNGSKKIFGKIFKKKDSQPSPSPSPMFSPTNNSLFRALRPSAAQPLVLPTPTQRNPKRNSRTGSIGPPPAVPQSVEPTPTPSPVTSVHVHHTSSHLQPAVLGIHPSCSSPSYPPHGRPHSYTWIVRKWIKGSNDSLLGNVIGHMTPLNLSEERRHSRPPPEEGAVQVQFIWTRGKKKRRQREGSQRVSTTSRQMSAIYPPKSASPSSLHRPGTADKGTSSAEKRLSVASGVSVSTASEVGSAGGRVRGDDAGEMSDPEDSETPWTCTLVVSRLGGGGGGGGGGGSGGGSGLQATGPPDGSGGSDGAAVRVRVATFSPTPHHPKVVALLKVPFPLPDIIVDQMQVCRRTVTAQGIARPSANADATVGLVLTAEEIKDIVSSTGLWLVVRESIGGVGKISRKGDGWRIRP